MPNRIIKEGLLTSESYAGMTLYERDLFWRLIVAADDFGRYDARPAIIRGRLMPLEETGQEEIARALESLAAKGLIGLYEHEGRPYLWLTGWERHQNIRAKRSKYPAPEAVNASECNCMQTQADAPVIQSVSESKTESESVSQSEPLAEGHTPTVDEVARYCQGKALAVDAQRFVDYYQARGWQVNNTPVRDWQALARLWHRSPTGPPKRVTQQNYTQRTYHFDDTAFMDKFMAGYEED